MTKKNMLVFDTTNFTEPDSDGRPAVRMEEIEREAGGGDSPRPFTGWHELQVRIAELEARLKEAEDRHEAHKQYTAELATMFDKAVAHNAKLRSALEQVEWGWVSFGSGSYHEVCAWCRNLKQTGHRSDCARQAALSPAEQEKEGKE